MKQAIFLLFITLSLQTCAKWAKMAKDSGENVAILWTEFNLAKYQ